MTKLFVSSTELEPPYSEIHYNKVFIEHTCSLEMDSKMCCILAEKEYMIHKKTIK